MPTRTRCDITLYHPRRLLATSDRPARAAGSLALALALLVVAPAARAPYLPSALAPAAFAQMPSTDPGEEFGVRIARVKYGGGGDWYSDPSSIPNWLLGFERRTGVRTQHDEKVVSLTDENLRAFPFLYMTGHGTIRLTPEELSALREHLENGGFLYADDNYGMDKSFRALVHQLFPEEPFVELPSSHPIYHSFYDLPGLPKIHKHDGLPPQGFGITIDGRLVLYYSYQSDIGDGLEDPEVHHDPPAKREQAMKMAVNVLMYAIMQNAFYVSQEDAR